LRSPYALHGCRRVLCLGNRYVIGETSPDGFGLWEMNGILPLATYSNDLRGWNAVLDDFLQTGDKPRPMSDIDRRRLLKRAG
jgi:hypothetical protein